MTETYDETSVSSGQTVAYPLGEPEPGTWGEVVGALLDHFGIAFEEIRTMTDPLPEGETVEDRTFADAPEEGDAYCCCCCEGDC